jgi:predicted nucleic acid-binding protein
MKQPPRSVLLDAEAVSAYAAGSVTVFPLVAAARRAGATLCASSATLAEATDGSARDAVVRRAMRAVETRPVTDEIGYRAGALRARSAASRKKPRALTVDALVAATALTLPSPVVVLTSDPDDMVSLLDDSHVVVEPVSSR